MKNVQSTHHASMVVHFESYLTPFVELFLMFMLECHFVSIFVFYIELCGFAHFDSAFFHVLTNKKKTLNMFYETRVLIFQSSFKPKILT
jgi:hypothetical protein